MNEEMQSIGEGGATKTRYWGLKLEICCRLSELQMMNRLMARKVFDII